MNFTQNCGKFRALESFQLSTKLKFHINTDDFKGMGIGIAFAYNRLKKSNYNFENTLVMDGINFIYFSQFVLKD